MHEVIGHTVYVYYGKQTVVVQLTVFACLSHLDPLFWCLPCCTLHVCTVENTVEIKQ